MGMVKGQKEYEKFQAGIKLSRRQAMLAHCYQCNGFEDSNTDCLGKSCPSYQFMPYRGLRKREAPVKGESLVQAGIVA